MGKRRAIIATAPDGGLLTARIADPPGYWARWWARIRWLASRLPWMLSGAAVAWLALGECDGATKALLGAVLLNVVVSLVVLMAVLAKG
jgi:hypothetical protein